MKPEDVILYHGPLRELNARIPTPSQKYVLVEEKEFVSQGYPGDPQRPQDIIKVKQELLGKGFHGLVSRRTLWDGGGLGASERFRVEGTPIVLRCEEE